MGWLPQCQTAMGRAQWRRAPMQRRGGRPAAPQPPAVGACGSRWMGVSSLQRLSPHRLFATSVEAAASDRYVPRTLLSAVRPEAVSTPTAPTEPSPLAVPTVRLRPGKERLFVQEQASLVFGGALQESLPADGTLGVPNDALVQVRTARDRDDELVGYGFYNADSMFRVRLLWQNALDGPQVPARRNEAGEWSVDVGALLQRRFAEARRIRERLGLLADADGACRVVNGDGDRLSGLCLDRYAQYWVAQSSALWVERHRGDVEAAIRRAFPEAQHLLLWRRNADRLARDGLPPSADAAETESAASSPTPSPTRVRVREHDLWFDVDLSAGQKTGHYCDQRDNRLRLRQLVQQSGAKRVLDLCCYTAGFALNAVLGGAAHVTAVDSSAVALEAARRNADLNGIRCAEERTAQDAAAPLLLVHDDMVRYCARLFRDDNEPLYDAVVLDPPKLAPTVSSLPRASARYRKLNRTAMQLVRPGGLLLTCSCSAAMTQSGKFLSVVQAAALELGRTVTLLGEFGAATDHVLSPGSLQSKYLTALLVSVSERRPLDTKRRHRGEASRDGVKE